MCAFERLVATDIIKINIAGYFVTFACSNIDSL